MFNHPLEDMIDRAIEKARREGQLDNLPGEGQPIKDLHAPKDAVLDRIAAEAGATSPLVVLRNQINDARAHLQTLTDPQARKDQMKVIADLQLRLSLEMEAHARFG
ncbi:DnaJ family domain-containing protein [Yoonia sp. 208BN28-4]|uniref:DnaJ family domain-containing protein n=1 Tax=Yoonia sp. 208BN28-4 TaxID=3126505 RepID=UPI0030958DD1